MQPIMNFIGNFGYVAVCIVGALLTMNNIISFGIIVTTILLVVIFSILLIKRQIKLKKKLSK